jgi:hypothetical protein
MSKKINEQVNDDGVGNENIVESTSEKPSESKHDQFSNIVLSGQGKKLSPKTDNHVFFDLAKHDEDGDLYLRLSANDGGGLHSKSWVQLETIIKILDEQGKKPFKSTVLKSVFTSSSANNPGFLAAILRSHDVGLITQSGKSVFLHVLATDYEEKKAELLHLADG